MRPLVIVPTYNERANLLTLVRGLLEIPDSRVLVVDDGSPDGTGALADELAARSQGRISVLHRTGPSGLGRAYLDGFEQALRTDADVICQMDADLSHRPRDLVAMLDAAKEADLVIGSRYVAGGQIVNWPLRRRLLSASANRYVRGICSIPVHDCTSGFRCWKRDALAALPLHRINLGGQLKTGNLWTGQNRQFPRRAETSNFYFVATSVRKSVWTFVRQLRGPHLSTCA